MLKNFLYLNEDSLAAYLSALEGGLRNSTERRTSTSSAFGGGINAKVVTGSADRNREDATTISVADTAQARFERLEEMATADVERSGWTSVVSPDDDLNDVGIGALIDIECEVYVPDMIRALSSTGGMTDALNMFDTLLPLADIFGLDTTKAPDSRQIAAVRSVVTNLGSDQVLVGERDDTEWRVAGKLLATHLRAEIEGVARVIGKVSAIWKRGEWKPLLSLPGMNLIPREQRRKLEQERPDPEQADRWLEGPAVMFDLLAVYR
jgi:hypothetical protein